CFSVGLGDKRSTLEVRLLVFTGEYLDQHVLFDLDGTLTNPRLGITRCMRYALDCLSVACPSDDVLTSFIGPPLRGTFATLLGTPDRERIEEAMARYRERFADTGLFENEVYGGIPELLAQATEAGAQLFVATSKPTVFAERVLTHFSLRPYFAGVYGSELDGRFEDKADLLEHLIEAERIAAKEAVMVGDRAADVVAARANGVRSIGVLWGYGSDAELTDAGADRLCRTPSELGAMILSPASRAQKIYGT
ncbi:MAG TPA: HAD hydrolase-like protein, partial [Pyrinomonadaceae bacterium]